MQTFTTKTEEPSLKNIPIEPSLKKKTKFNIAPYLYLAPAFIIFTIFIFYPFAKTVLFSFTLTNARGEAIKFVGINNYTRIFSNELFKKSLNISFIFAPMVGIPVFFIAFFLASLANERVRGSRLYETMYSIPMAVASAPAAAIWIRLLNPGKSGIVNFILGTDKQWLQEEPYALISVAIVTVWLSIGASFIFLLTGFRNVSDELLESARIDGAGYFTRLFRIIAPVASPQIFFVVFLNIVTSFQAFAQVKNMTENNPSTNVLVYSIYNAAIRDSRYETAFAQSIVLFVIILVITRIQFLLEDKVVHYQ